MSRRRHDVSDPTQIRLKDWRSIVVRVWQRMLADGIGVLSGGIAFYAFLSVFPAVAALLMVWGLFTDMTKLGPQLEALRGLTPDAFSLITDQMVAIVNQPRGDLTLGLIISAVLALWSASGGVSALMGAMNLAYHEKEKRGFIRLTATSLGFTLGGIVFVVLSAAAIAAIPPILEALRLGQTVEALIRVTRWLMMVGIFFCACAMIYRIAPSRVHARWRWIIPGALVASIMWLLASVAFSFYLANFSNYNATFGSLGAVAALLMWFWLTAYVIVMGAELNSQLELFTTQDTTIGAPAKPGERGAAVADKIEEPSKAFGPTPQAEEVTPPKDLPANNRERVEGSRVASSQSSRKA